MTAISEDLFESLLDYFDTEATVHNFPRNELAVRISRELWNCIEAPQADEGSRYLGSIHPETINDILKYLDNRQDADYDYESERYVGNREMRLHSEMEHEFREMRLRSEMEHEMRNLEPPFPKTPATRS